MLALLQLVATLLTTPQPPRTSDAVHPNATGCNIQTQRKIPLPHLNSHNRDHLFPNKATEPHFHIRLDIPTPAPPARWPIKPNQTHQTQRPNSRAAETHRSAQLPSQTQPPYVTIPRHNSKSHPLYFPHRTTHQPGANHERLVPLPSPLPRSVHHRRHRPDAGALVLR